jgi:hypothetical protein
MEQINLEDNQKELKSGDGKDGEGDFFSSSVEKDGGMMSVSNKMCYLCSCKNKREGYYGNNCITGTR